MWPWVHGRVGHWRGYNSAMVLGCCLSFPTFLHLKILFIIWIRLNVTFNPVQLGIANHFMQQGVVTLIHTILTAKTRVKEFWLSLLLFDCSTALQNGFWPFDRTGNHLMTVDYTHILSFDPIRKWRDPTPSLVYRVRMPGLSCYYGVYGSDHPLCSMLLTWMCHSHTADEKVPNIPTAVEAN